MSLMPGQGVKIPYALWPKTQKVKQKQHCNKFNKDFKNGPHLKKNLKKKTLKILSYIRYENFKNTELTASPVRSPKLKKKKNKEQQKHPPVC